MASKADSSEPVDDLSFEAAVAELESIVEHIEAGELPLEVSMQRHRRGRALVQRCRSMLEVAETELEQAAVEDLPDSSQGDA
jgi:exodeoxyribonuclease VII small subunit